MDNLSTLTIADASRRLREGSVKAVELTQSCIDRIESVDAKLNAVICRTFDRALEQAKKIDASTDKNGSPLAGIPYLTKDVFCEEGVPSTVASNVLRGVRGDLLRLAERRVDGPAVTGIQRAAGEGRLPGVRSHVMGALDEQQVWALRALAQEHEYRRGPATLGRG